MPEKNNSVVVLAGAGGPSVGGPVCARLDGQFDFYRPEALSRVETAVRETGAATVAVLSGAQTNAVGVLLLLAARRDVAVLAPAAWFPVLTGRGRVATRPFAGETMVAFPALPPAGRGWGGRLLAAVALLPVAPLLLVLALVVRLGDGGKGFFTQQRFGINGRPFRIFKLRTMHPDAEEHRGPRVVGMADRSDRGDDDPRVTRFGRWLRRHGVDELPQLLNVVRGEMRLVGPRPLPEYEDWQYQRPWHRARLDGVPGITGLWQVCGRNQCPFDEMCQLDIWYLRNRSLGLDLRILLRTLAVLWRG